MTQHHKYSPSKLKCLMHCPGYTSAEGTSEAAEEGTMLHEACETGITPEHVTDEQRACVAACRGYCADLERDAREVRREQRLEIMGGALFGTADIVLLDKDGDAHVVDYKFGRVSVDHAETNLQGWAYAVGTFELWPHVTRVTVHFLQPRRDEVSSWTFDREADLPTMQATIARVLLHTEQNAGNPAAYRPEHGLCLWCGRKAECPRVAELTAALVANTHAALELPAVLVPAQMTPDQLTRALDVASIVKDHVFKWADMVKAEALQRTRNGVQVGDYVLARRSGKRAVVDAIAASAVLAERYGLTREDIAACVSMSVTEMEKRVAAAAGKGRGSAAKEQLANELEAAGLVACGEGYEYLKKLN